MRKRIMSVFLVLSLVISLLPVSVVASEPEKGSTENTISSTAPASNEDALDESKAEYVEDTAAQTEMEITPNDVAKSKSLPSQEIYVSVDGDDETGDGTIDNPYATLIKAVESVNKSATIYVMSDLTLYDSVRYWDSKDITITSLPAGEKDWKPCTISRAKTGFHAVQDEARGGYNGAMIEIGNGASLTLMNIALDDGGFAAYTNPDNTGAGTISGECPYFIQVTSGGGGFTMVGDEKVSNHKIVQDAIIASYDAGCTITLGKGAVLQNYGGMSAVRASGATLIMQTGSKIWDSKDFTRTSGAEGSLGSTGAVWVQNGTFTMQQGAEISSLDGRAVYADRGEITIDGVISNLTYNASFQNAFQGLAVHLRGGANGNIPGEIKEITLPAGNNISALHIVDSGNLTISGTVHDIHNGKTKNRVVNGEGIDAAGKRTEVTISGEIYNITGGYVICLSHAAKGILSGTLRNLNSKAVYLVDGSGEPNVGDPYATEFDMTQGAVIRDVKMDEEWIVLNDNSNLFEALVSRSSLTAPDGNRNIPFENRDHVTFTIDGEITNVKYQRSGSNLIWINADINAFSEYAKTPGEYINCTIGSNAIIHENTASRIISTQSGTVDIFGKIYNNTACVYKGFNNCGDAVVNLHDGMEIYNNDSSLFQVSDWDGNCVIGVSSAIVTMKGGKIHDNTSSGSASAIYVGTGGKFIMAGGEIYNNNNISETGGQISFCSGTTWPDVVDSSVEFKGGKIYNNTSEGNHDLVITPSTAGSFTGAADNRERCFTVPNETVTEDNGIYYQPITHSDKATDKTVIDYYGMSMAVLPGTKLGVLSQDQKKGSAVIREGSITVLTTAASGYGLSSPFAGFWIHNETGTPVSILMDPSQIDQKAPTLNPEKPVYLMIQPTGTDGYPANNAKITLTLADVDENGTIRFTLPKDMTGSYGAAIALAQPAEASGALSLSTSVAELHESETPYNVPYTVTFNLDQEGISKDAIEKATVQLISSYAGWNGQVFDLSLDTMLGSWTGTLPETDFEPDGMIITSALLTITTDTQTSTFLAKPVSTKMVSGAIHIQPANITVYTGGIGYTGTVDDDGEIIKSDGLPEPGYYITLPKSINDKLGGTADAADLSDKLEFKYSDENESREWQLELYGSKEHSTDISGISQPRYIYRLLPWKDGTGKEKPVRLQFTDSETNEIIVSDDFNPKLDAPYHEYDMNIYSNDLNVNKITAEIVVGDKIYSCPVKSDKGKLQVRGLTDETIISDIILDSSQLTKQFGAVAPDNVAYYINGSNVELTDTTGVKLLVDEVLDNNVLTEYIENNITEIPDNNYVFDQQYLDLVDTTNGNAYLTLGKDQKMEVYWQVPSDYKVGSKYYLVHFDGLDRNYNNIEKKLEENAPKIIPSELTKINGRSYIKFETNSFSPFVLVYERNSGGGGGVTEYFTLSYDTNGGNPIPSESNGFAWVKAYKDLPVPTRNGFIFDGWYLDSGLTQLVTSDVDVNTSSVTLYAGWHEDVSDPDDTGVSDWLNTKDHFSYFHGYETGTFYPEREMTRAEAAQIFYNVLLNQNVPITVSFSDVPEDAWYADAVNTLASLGFIKGIGANRFNPERSITRAEFTAIAMRFTNGGQLGENIFSDIDEEDWYYEPVVRSIQYGWIKGYEDGTFHPNHTISRAEVTAVANRMLGRSADKTYINQNIEKLHLFPDVDRDYWAFYHIVEATNGHEYTKHDGLETWDKLGA